MPKTTDLASSILERVTAIARMENHHLLLDWRNAFTISQLMDCCDRMDKHISGVYVPPDNLQRELIQSPAFAAWFSGFLALLPDEPLAEAKPAPVYGTYRQGSTGAARPAPSRRSTLICSLGELVEQCWANGRDITSYAQRDVVDVLEIDRLDSVSRLIYLDNFTPMYLSEECREIVVNSLHKCIGVPLELSEKQKALLLEPFAGTRHLFASASFSDICTLLDACPALVDILRLMHGKDVSDTLTMKHYQGLVKEAPECCRLLTAIVERLGAQAASAFVLYWQQSDCSMYELRTMERRTADGNGRDWTEPFANYSEYVNALYGQRFRHIDMASLSSKQEDILIYAIVHNKKHFIKLVDEHPELFLDLPDNAMLLQPDLYKQHFNLNELTEKDLVDCAQMKQRKLSASTLIPGRRYTFPELRALYGVSDQYLMLYHALASPSQDYRLLVFRQLLNGDVLFQVMGDDDIAVLASRLDVKPLHDWMRDELGHIDGLTAADAAKLLIHLDELRTLLPGIRTRTDALLALRNREPLARYESIDALKADLCNVDVDWQRLSERMALSEAFKEKYRESIVAFLCENGAAIAEKYLNRLDGKQQEAFLRVVKAELMGQLCQLKYFGDDLQVELDAPLTALIKTEWPTNLHIKDGNMEVREHDDFFSTMLLGTQPQRTCLSYADGAYSACLLSAFDSNKKVLYVYLNGRVVGRAFLRLTKGRICGADKSDRDDESDFTFVDLEDASAPRTVRSHAREEMTLFLERPYISGVGPELRQQVKNMLVSLAMHKADDMDVMLVLSQDYHDKSLKGFTSTRYGIYISRSKAGAQYLDSLGGEAKASTVGDFYENTFLIRERR